MTKTTNFPRIIIQWGVIIFILLLAFSPGIFKVSSPDFEAYCPFGGMQALGSYLLNDSLSCTMTSAQIVMGVLLFAGVIFFSKLFCSFICPVGTIAEALGKIGDKLKFRFTIKGIADKALRSLKYILLFLTLYFTLQSNELFCKKFDPYYGIASGFDTDVVLLYAVISITLVVLGSVFIRLFWCKYLCPLGAVSNIFRFTIFFAITLVIYIALLKTGLTISYVWPLSIVCAGGYIIELSGQKSRIFPLVKITRNTDSCTGCQLCSRKCPQAIDVVSLNTVKHIDCNLCGDCLLICPEKNTLAINRKKKLNRFPVITTVLLVILGISLGSVWEIPTIDQHWGSNEEIEAAAIFNQSGLKNIKCYGSSITFANQMKKVDGIYGVATFVKNHRVKIYYNPEILDETKIQKLLFTPQKKVIHSLEDDAGIIYVATLKLENFFDSFDFNYLSILLEKKTNAVGLISEFGCPVTVKIFFNEIVENTDKLISTIESKTLTYETDNGMNTIKTGFITAGKPEFSKIGKNEYATAFFTPFESSFNNRKNYSEDVIKSYYLPLGKNQAFRNRYNYLVSHISNDTGIIGFITKLDTGLNEIAEIIYVDSLTNIEKINTALLNDTLTITYSNKTIEKIPNIFDFSEITQNNQEMNNLSAN